MHLRPRFFFLPLAILLATPPVAGGEDAAVREPAADGTVSVVVAPPAGGRGEQAAASMATDVLSKALEPLDAGAQAGATAGPHAAMYARPLPLVEALERSGDRARRLWISQAYWKVSAGFAMLRWSTEALERLVECYLALGIPDEARKSAAVLGANYPGSEWYKRSYGLIQRHVPAAPQS
jgi:hypothetical protein